MTPTPVLIFTRGERLAAARRRAGITVAEMAHYLGTSVATVGNYEHDRTYAKPPIVAMYARLTGYPESEFNDPDDDNTPSGQVRASSRCILQLAAA